MIWEGCETLYCNLILEIENGSLEIPKLPFNIIFFKRWEMKTCGGTLSKKNSLLMANG
jgi:hypothetical protein